MRVSSTARLTRAFETSKSVMARPLRPSSQVAARKARNIGTAPAAVSASSSAGACASRASAAFPTIRQRWRSSAKPASNSTPQNSASDGEAAVNTTSVRHSVTALSRSRSWASTSRWAAESASRSRIASVAAGNCRGNPGMIPVRRSHKSPCSRRLASRPRLSRPSATAHPASAPPTARQTSVATRARRGDDSSSAAMAGRHAGNAAPSGSKAFPSRSGLPSASQRPAAVGPGGHRG